MSCQRESEGSPDGTAEWESCEGGTCKESLASVEEIRNLVSSSRQICL